MSVYFKESNVWRDTALFVAQVRYTYRTSRSGDGGEVEITGKAETVGVVRVLAPSEAFARQWIAENYSTWGPFEIIAIEPVEVHGSVSAGHIR